MKHTLVATLGVSCLLAFAAPAHAETDTDTFFISAVDEAGIEYTSPQDAIGVAHEVCDYLAGGHRVDGAARALQISNRALSPKKTAKFVTYAQAAYCPELATG
ncbi:DUF732 domain-containing protein [Mycolicibacter sp. MYC123]|uniref:DUF732 domain-containing protein n=1 Tax=[Mycobacterium] zoologicum TaxID=2872311 RepID=A0ABU5YKZ7_9MYCO|nr:MULTISPECIES: DUF732 domain-containing protein [unclassified Mycolicibacter]MEB3050109.1 DUF732 domain-containing protein [Mycolicibacter sp. MYC123]MEB3065345.1 DUF732 domain-containing protein [Mycolicibacter sp. MYC101]